MATYTITINERTREGKRLAALLRASKQVTSFRESERIPDLEEALEDVREGRVNTYSSVDELMTALKKKAGVHDTNNQ
ncbi:MAG: hypothetical protein AB2L20_29635 [Mangrovibacterium sp.]|jgi:hypothetical protein